MTGKVLGTIVALFAGAGVAGAQVPSDIEAGLRKIGQIVDPACTSMLAALSWVRLPWITAPA